MKKSEITNKNNKRDSCMPMRSKKNPQTTRTSAFPSPTSTLCSCISFLLMKKKPLDGANKSKEFLKDSTTWVQGEEDKKTQERTTPVKVDKTNMLQEDKRRGRFCSSTQCQGTMKTVFFSLVSLSFSLPFSLSQPFPFLMYVVHQYECCRQKRRKPKKMRIWINKMPVKADCRLE